jgi:hypothetical protein
LVVITLKRNTLQKNAPSRAALFAAHAFTLLALFMLASFVAQAQPQAAATPQQQDDAAPPMRHLPDAVRKQLDDAHDLKSRTRLSLELADASITRATEHATAERFEQATSELGIYEAIVEDSIRFVQRSGKVTNKQRDLFKRIEMALRSHVPRLETIRRTLPAAHAVYVKTTIEFVRDQRDRALNAFYDDTVIPDASPSKDKSPSPERVTGAANNALQEGKKPDQ